MPRQVPFFGRPDGVRVADLPAFRRAMPVVLRHRHEAEIFHAITFDLSKSRGWLRRYNSATEGPKATFFHLFLWAAGRTLHVFPQMNRFVAGNHIYQRSTACIAFSVKKERSENAPFVLVKLDMPRDETFPHLVARVTDSAAHVRDDTGRRGLAELELALVKRLPPVVTGVAVRALRLANRLSLLPASMIDDDALFSSLLVANLGSVGLDAPFHHLSDYGSCSLFAAIGLIAKRPIVIDGALEVRDTVTIRWTLDERVTDGFYAGRAMDHVRGPCEDPAAFIGPAR